MICEAEWDTKLACGSVTLYVRMALGIRRRVVTRYDWPITSVVR